MSGFTISILLLAIAWLILKQRWLKQDLQSLKHKVRMYEQIADFQSKEAGKWQKRAMGRLVR